MKASKILLALVALGLAGAGVFAYTGIYNIGADAPHWTITRTAIDTFRERSIISRSNRIKVPPLDDSAMIAEGAEHYRAMCVTCHLAPGIENTELREGLYPLPPNLTEHKHEEHGFNDLAGDAARQFWIIKHGIKMTSMPAAGKTHDDETIWGMVAFLRKLPEMTPDEYARLGSSEDGHEHAEGETHERGGTAPREHNVHQEEVPTIAPAEPQDAPSHHHDAPEAPPH